MLNVSFESPTGTVWPSRQFQQGQQVHVVVSATTTQGLPAWGSTVQIDIFGSGFPEMYQSQIVNALGHVDFDFTMPYVNARASMLVRCWFLGINILSPPSFELTVPISVGNVTPDPLPTPPGDLASSILKWAAIGAAVIAIVWGVQKSGVLKKFKT